MKKNSNVYIIVYATVMIVIVAVLLSVAALSLHDRQYANIVVEKQTAILNAMNLGQDASKAKDKTQYIQAEYQKYIIDSYAVNCMGEKIEGVDAFGLLDNLKAEYAADPAERRLPVFEARLDNGNKLYVLPIYGAGLWGPIWGYLALEDDLDTIYGASFDHKGETPGLGAEITTAAFSKQFEGKKIFNNGKFVAVSVIKGQGSSAGNMNAVDAVSGGTITSRGVQSMLYSCLEAYLPFIERVSAEKNRSTNAD